MVDLERVFVPNSTIKAVLEYAASTLEFDNEGDCQWAKGYVAIDHLCRPCSPYSVKACAWCLGGALLLAGLHAGGDKPCEPDEFWREDSPAACAASDMLATKLKLDGWSVGDENVTDSWDVLGVWNDDPSRTLSDVVSALRDVAGSLDVDEEGRYGFGR